MKKISALGAMGLFLSLVSFSAHADSLKIDADDLKFTLQPVQSGVDTVCEHKLINPASQDWEVVCKDKEGKTRRRYTVHLWVSRYSHGSGPKVSFEVLYWVDDRTKPQEIKALGTTTWFHLNEETSIHSLQLGQIVDNGQATLEAEIKAPHSEK